jgi:broad specificity phosphatase PhoE
MKVVITHIVALAVLAIAGAAYGQGSDLKSLLPAMKSGGYVIVLRHGATDPKQEDVYPLDYSDMSKQRQLSDAGRDVARQVGAAFKKVGVPIGTVYTSRLNRAQETGKLISGKDVTAREELNDSSMGSTSAMAGSAGGGSSRHGEALRKMATAPTAPGTNTLIVTHKTNITDAFGKDWGNVKEGEATIFKGDGATTMTPVARVQASDWVALAAAP